MERHAQANGGHRFRHALVQDAAYASLLHRRRRAIHARVAAIIGTDWPEVAVTEPETLAHHWAEGGFPERAVPCWLAAGRQALARAAAAEAAAQFGRALDALDRVPDLETAGRLAFEAWLGLGRASYVVNGPAHADTVAAFTHAQGLVEHVADADERCILLYGIFSGYHFASRFDLAEAPARRMLALAQKDGERTQLCLAHRMLGYLAFFRGDAEEARRCFRAITRLYHPVEDGRLAVRYGADCWSATQGFHAVLDALAGRVSSAETRVDRALAHARAIKHPPSIGWAHAASCYVRYVARDRAGTARTAAEGAAYCKDLGIAMWELHCRLFATWAGDEIGAEAGAVRKLIEAAAAGTSLGLPLFRGVLAELLAAGGERVAASREVDRALAEIEQNGQRVFLSFLHRLRGELGGAEAVVSWPTRRAC